MTFEQVTLFFFIRFDTICPQKKVLNKYITSLRAYFGIRASRCISRHQPIFWYYNHKLCQASRLTDFLFVFKARVDDMRAILKSLEIQPQFWPNTMVFVFWICVNFSKPWLESRTSEVQNTSPRCNFDVRTMKTVQGFESFERNILSKTNFVITQSDTVRFFYRFLLFSFTRYQGIYFPY